VRPHHPRGRSVELLAEPEFDRGAISPDTRLDRLARWYAAYPGSPPPRHDLEVALLRLPPGIGDQFWSQCTLLDPATAATACRAHTVAQLRLHFESRSTLVHIPEPPAPCPDSNCWRLLATVDYPRISDGTRAGLRRRDAEVAGWPLLCPWQPELGAAYLLWPLAHASGSGVTALSHLAHPGHPLGPVGHLALVRGLASDDPSTRIAAADVWLAAAQDGRLEGPSARVGEHAARAGPVRRLRQLHVRLARQVRRHLSEGRSSSSFLLRVRWVDHQLEYLAVRSTEMLPEIAVSAFSALAEKLNASSKEFLGSRVDVLNEKVGHNFVTRELLWRM
jgi:hypothetical protein